MPARDEPVECLPWTLRTGVCPCFPAWERRCPERTAGGLCQSYLMLFAKTCRIIEFQDGSCLYVTAAVKQPATLAGHKVTTAVKVLLRFVGTCRELSPPPPPSLPLSFFAFWGFPEWSTQDHPSLSLVCPWTTVRSWEHLPFSFSFLSLSLPLSFFLSFLSFFPLFTFLLPWVSLDAFVIAGNPSPLFFWCVLGRLCRSWEHLPFLSFLFLFSSLPTPPSCQDLRVGCY